MPNSSTESLFKEALCCDEADNIPLVFNTLNDPDITQIREKPRASAVG